MYRLLVILGLFVLDARAQEMYFPSDRDTGYSSRLVRKLNNSFFQKPDSTIYYAEKIMQIPREQANLEHRIYAMQLAGEAYRTVGNFPKSLSLQLGSLRESRSHGLTYLEGKGMSFVGFTYLLSGFSRQALNYILPARSVLENSRDTTHASFNASNAALAYIELGMLDSARYFNDVSLQLFHSVKQTDGRHNALRTLIFSRIGRWHDRMGAVDSAKLYYRLCTDYALRDNIRANFSAGNNDLAGLFLREGRYDSSLVFARRAFANSSNARLAPSYVESAEILADAFKALANADSALFYLAIAKRERDSVFGPRKFRELQVLMAEEQDHQQALEAERIEDLNRQKLMLMGAAIAVLGLMALILRKNNRAEKALNRQLTEQKQSLVTTLDTLRSTQKQLIQSEKMASLGELTAGIAHEIQNPLNFVNNFSDLNREIIEELKDELRKGDMQQAIQLAESIRENEDKINLHGKRADGIVKSMLQHSRASSGIKEPTEVNKLVEEYVRLAYHGYRARQKDLNVRLDIDLDPSVGKAGIVAQDIGRVLLNLLNNAFYAVHEKSRTAGDHFTPTVSIKTRRILSASGVSSPNPIAIEIEDNGLGIPEELREKIFQPFFTTKPTGQGTGLGLSLSYDIITKGNGGTLEVDSRKGEGTRFTVVLPSN